MKCFFITCGPNEAIIVSGCGHRKPLMVPGGRVFVWPLFQEWHKYEPTFNQISLNVMTLQVDSPMVYTCEGVPISVTGIAQIKIQGQNREMLSTACELFLGKSEREIALIALATLEGHQRAIMGSMTVEEIYKDRKKFSINVFEVASSDLVNMGITVVSYTLKDIRDDEEYLKHLGMARTAEVKRDARIGEAEAKRDATIKEAKAEEERVASRLLNDTEIAKAKRDYELKKAEAEVQVEKKKAEAEMAFELQTAIVREKVAEEKMKIAVVERSTLIDLEEAELTRKLQQLEATVKIPAAAEKYKMQKLAEANRNRVILEAQAEAEALRLMGEAEAFAIEAKAKAENEQMTKKAQAFNEYHEAAIIDMILDVLPKVASAISTPLSETKRISIISSGGEDIGVAKVTSEVFSILTQIPNFVKSLTGIDIAQSINEMS